MFIRFLDGTVLNTDNLIKIEIETYGDGSGLRFTLTKGEVNLKLSSKREALALLERVWNAVAQNVNCIDLSLLIQENKQKTQLLVEG